MPTSGAAAGAALDLRGRPLSDNTQGSSAADVLSAAHEYRRRGWRVIPLHRVGPDGKTCSCRKGGNCGRNAGKHPIDLEWQKAPALSAADVEETWGVAKPPNIGLATGPDSGFWALDIDPKNGGMESMAALVAEHGALPETFVAQTGSEGYHYLFALPEGVVLKNSADRVGKGIDTRAAGGQIVAPPSRSGVGPYRVVVDAPVAAAPAWLIELARAPEVDPSQVVTSADLPRPEDIPEEEWARPNGYAEKAVAGNIDRLKAMAAAATGDQGSYRGEPWNDTTFKVAAALIEIANSPWFSYGLGQAYKDVFLHAPRDPEFNDETVNRTFESAREKVGDGARAIPVNRQQQAEPDPLFTSPT